jgi:hypothetical protein
MANAKASPVDRLRDAIFGFISKDIDVMSDVAGLSEMDTKDMAALLALPASAFPYKTDEGYVFRSKKHVRLALAGTLPKKEWPAGLQAAHERVVGITKLLAPKDDRPVSVTNNLVMIPAQRQEALPDEQRLRMRRGPDGKLQQVFDVPVVVAIEAKK